MVRPDGQDTRSGRIVRRPHATRSPSRRDAESARMASPHRSGLPHDASPRGDLAGNADAAADEPVDYTRQVKPILKGRCYACHGALKHKAGLRLDTGGSIRAGGDSGPALAAGAGDESLLIERVTEADPAERMPPEGPPLTAEQVALLRAWIDQGAARRRTRRPRPTRASTGRFSRSSAPAVPAAGDARWVRDPIDAFLDARMRAAGTGAPGRRRAAGPAPPGLPRPDRPAPDARTVARVPRRPLGGRLRAGRGPAAGEPAVRRALGPALDGRLAVQRLVRPPRRAGRAQQLRPDLALARLDRALAERG